MAPVPSADDAISIGEVAQILGVDRTTAHRWSKDMDLGFPEATLIAGRRVWSRTEVRAWAKTAKRPSIGRPPKQPSE
jgi:predicted DNA-binding transcriptional regulator AlpA